MKRRLSIILVIMISITAGAQAQITFEERLPVVVYSFNTSQGGTWFAEYAYYTSDPSINVYRSDYSLYKEIYPPLTDTNSLNFDALYLSDHLFNLDDKLEYILIRFNVANTLECVLVNEDGELLYDFGNFESMGPVITQRTNMSPILEVYHYDEQNTLVTDLYSLPGVYLPVKHPGSNGSTSYPSPNPTSNSIRIPYKVNTPADALLSIYNDSGAMVEKRILDKNETSLTLDVSNLPTGAYIYEYGNVTGKFIVSHK